MRDRRCKAHRSSIDLGDEMCAKAYAAYRRGAPYPPAYPCESVEVLVIEAERVIEMFGASDRGWELTHRIGANETVLVVADESSGDSRSKADEQAEESMKDSRSKGYVPCFCDPDDLEAEGGCTCPRETGQ